MPYLTAIDLESLSGDQQRQALIAALRELVLDDLRRWDGEDFSEGILTILNSGECLLVLDGLDEVPQEARHRVRLAVGALDRRVPYSTGDRDLPSTVIYRRSSSAEV